MNSTRHSFPCVSETEGEELLSIVFPRQILPRLFFFFFFQLRIITLYIYIALLPFDLVTVFQQKNIDTRWYVRVILGGVID